MAQDNARLAREHTTKAEEYTKQAGQHTASAASTIGHDLRAAGDQLAEAGKYVGARLTAPVEGEDVHDKAHKMVDRSNKYADAKADEAADVTKSTYNKIKDSIGGFFGSAKESAEETANTAADKTHDAAHKAADTVNKGVDKAHESQRSVYESTPSQREVHAQGKEAYESAKDAAVQTKDAVVGGLQYVGGRLTAPVSGSESKDRELADKAKEKTRSAADAVSGGAQSAKEQTGEAAEHAKQQGKGLFASIKDAFSAPAEHKEEPKSADLHAKATNTINSLEDQAKGAYHNVQDKVTQMQEDAKRQMREAQESLEPKTHTEAVLSEGGIPSNTADLLKQRELSGAADQSAHESMQGQHIGVESLLDKTGEAWGGDHLTGDGNLDSVRNAADAAGPHSTHR